MLLMHIEHFAACVAEHLDGLARVFARHIDGCLLDGFELVAVLVFADDDARTAHLEFEALATHGFHQDGKVQNAAASYLDAR